MIYNRPKSHLAVPLVSKAPSKWALKFENFIQSARIQLQAAAVAVCAQRMLDNQINKLNFLHFLII